MEISTELLTKINTSEWEVQHVNEPTKTVARVPKAIEIKLIKSVDMYPFLEKEVRLSKVDALLVIGAAGER
jgi:hypothetical protein